MYDFTVAPYHYLLSSSYREEVTRGEDEYGRFCAAVAYGLTVVFQVLLVGCVYLLFRMI